MGRIDMTGKTCRCCSKGKYRENSLYDDWEGMVTCPKCLDRVKRHQEG
jgi:hypothetical protein